MLLAVGNDDIAYSGDASAGWPVALYLAVAGEMRTVGDVKKHDINRKEQTHLDGTNNIDRASRSGRAAGLAHR